LQYATFLGGDGWDYGHAVDIGPNGYVYLTGVTDSPNFQITAGAFDTSCGSDGTCNDRPFWGTASDIFISKFIPAGNGLADLHYSTYLGGAGNDGDHPFLHDLVLGPNGDVILTSHTLSPDFPTTIGAFDRTCGTDGNCNSGYGSDGVIVQMDFDETGQDALIYSTYFGGADDEYSEALALADDGAIYAAGQTASYDFPATPSAFDRVRSGPKDGFVIRLNPVNATTTDVDTYIQAPVFIGAEPGNPGGIPISYGNMGLTEAISIVVTATLDADLTYLSDSSGTTPSQPDANTLVWGLPNLAFEAWEVFSLMVTLPNDPLGTTYQVNLEIGSAGPEAFPADNQRSVEMMAAELLYLPLINR
jgi:hypothetical protein